MSIVNSMEPFDFNSFSFHVNHIYNVDYMCAGREHVVTRPSPVRPPPQIARPVAFATSASVLIRANRVGLLVMVRLGLRQINFEFGILIYNVSQFTDD